VTTTVLPEVLWQERKAENINFYANAIASGFVRTIPQEFTTRKANCDCCLKSNKPGMRVLFKGLPGAHRFHVCRDCFPELVNAVPLTELICTLKTG
jgi:hypothetical protein